MKVVTADQMREIEARAAKVGLTSPILMENAGLAVAKEISNYLGEVAGLKIVVLVGPGNNGGDGLVAARHLHDWGASITVYLCTVRSQDDKNLKLVIDREVVVISTDQDDHLINLQKEFDITDVVLDAIFGTGKVRPLESVFRESLIMAEAARKRRKNLRIIALDLPSGLNPDTGIVDPACPTADLTITLSSPKVGLYSFPGAEKAGKVIVSDIGIPESIASDINLSLITEDWIKEKLPDRPLNANKGTFGKVLIIAGSIKVPLPLMGEVSFLC